MVCCSVHTEHGGAHFGRGFLVFFVDYFGFLWDAESAGLVNGGKGTFGGVMSGWTSVGWVCYEIN